MNIAQVREHLTDIKQQARDDEAAHTLEDELHVAVLRAIANNTAEPSAQALAQCALESLDIGFSRCCA